MGMSKDRWEQLKTASCSMESFERKKSRKNSKRRLNKSHRRRNKKKNPQRKLLLGFRDKNQVCNNCGKIPLWMRLICVRCKQYSDDNNS